MSLKRFQYLLYLITLFLKTILVHLYRCLTRIKKPESLCQNDIVDPIDIVISKVTDNFNCLVARYDNPHTGEVFLTVNSDVFNSREFNEFIFKMYRDELWPKEIYYVFFTGWEYK